VSDKIILLIISGQPRFTRMSSRNIKKMIVNPLNAFGYDVHILMSLWSSNSFDKFTTTIGKEVDASAVREFKTFLQPKQVEFFPSQDFFSQRDTNKIQVPLREAPAYESQYICLSRAAKLAQRYCHENNLEPCAAIRTRADLLFFQPLQQEVVEKAKTSFFVPNRQGFGWIGMKPPDPWKLGKKWLPDQFWIGPWNQVNKMCSFYDFWHSGLRVHGDNIEKMLYAFSEENGIKISTFDSVIKIEKTINNR
jgi:hypothetical protein